MLKVSWLTRASVRQVLLGAVALAVAAVCSVSRASTSDGLAISGSPSRSATVGQAYSFQPTVSDPTKRPVTFVIENKPVWASFSTSTGQLSGTPTAAYAGKNFSNIEIIAKDGVAQAALIFSVEVNTATTGTGSGTGALVISGTPLKTATVGQAYSFTPTASDSAKHPVTFVIVNKPAWAAFSASTGQLSGTPTAAYAGDTFTNIEIIAKDGASQAALIFSLNVATAVTADKPVISGTPVTNVAAGSSYTFQPSAKDPAGKTLSFSVQNKPAWAAFSIASGLLDGKPSSTQTGTYGNIVITASNGSYSTALPAFTITVTPATTTGGSGAATLSWTPPTENTNGTALTNLGGYHLHYGTSPSNLGTVVQIPASSTTLTVSNLAAATWYFAMSAYTNTGVESALSQVTSKTIP
jgi:hypothetical protein